MRLPRIRLGRIRYVAAVLVAVAAATIPSAAAGKGSTPRVSRAADALAAGLQTGSFTLLEDTISSVHQALRTGQVSCRELVLAYLYRMATYDKNGPSFHAVITMNGRALQRAAALDRERRDPQRWGSLYCVPMLVKDAIDTAGLTTTGGSLALAGMVPTRDATVVGRIEQAGAIVIAKTNLDELTRGVWGASSVGGQIKNAYALGLNPGGSSGGTAVGLAANYGVVGLGTDTCGSIRSPSSFNNIVGLRPTHGLVSLNGVMPNAQTTDTVGPMARTVTDLAKLLNVIAGVDARDPITRAAKGHVATDYTAFLRPDGLRGKRIGIVRQLFGTGPDAATVNAVIDDDVRQLRALGATVVDPVVAPDVELMNLGHFPYWGTWESRFQFPEYLKSLGSAAPIHTFQELADIGSAIPAINSGLQQSAAITSLDDPAYQEVIKQGIPMAERGALTPLNGDHLDALLYPTVQVPPAPIGGGQDGINCVWSALSGFPAISVPGGFTGNGLPVGMELLGRPWSEGTLIQLAYGFEQGTHFRRPSPFAPAVPGAPLGGK